MWWVASEPGNNTNCRRRPCSRGRKKARVILLEGKKTTFQWMVVSKRNPHWKQAFPFAFTSNVESQTLEAEAGGEMPGGKTDIKRQLLPITETTCDIPSSFAPEGVSSHNCLSYSARPQWHGCRAEACLKQNSCAERCCWETDCTSGNGEIMWWKTEYPPLWELKTNLHFQRGLTVHGETDPLVVNG